MTTATVAGNVTRVDQRGKNLFCFEGTNLHKVGTGGVVTVSFADQRYAGELVAIGPRRAILLIAANCAEHGVLRDVAARN